MAQRGEINITILQFSPHTTHRASDLLRSGIRYLAGRNKRSRLVIPTESSNDVEVLEAESQLQNLDDDNYEYDDNHDDDDEITSVVDTRDSH